MTDYASVQFEFAGDKIDMGSLTRFTRATAWVQKRKTFLEGSDASQSFPFDFFKGLTSIFRQD